ncbi:RICIN domain-containing protein [Streptomyces europaeiscabiei]|uniref:RICIN domain-containing protein n=1 Tax=Streptomyces europaeiscabiei TaxID=146819 RepID=UPI000699838E|nr:RICIN domain-containing protein [Streptomyces europaeiscabiei]MDX2526847.1 RICIN domain-containing protein [Streptomyces europaeiscabiei]MDX2761411.1 RICIN domain-containing protein [Streptomyces europaeiscabiei]MDX3669000.1 RICIN domain-containing protein [Streptomyces europaeiscabiei]
MSRALKAARRTAAAVLALGSVLFLSPSPAQAAGYQELKNVESRKCLAIAHSDPGLAVSPIQWTCNNDDEQRWELRHVKDEWYQLVNKATQRCLTGVNDGIKPFQLYCSETDSHLWLKDSIGRLRNNRYDYCLAVPHSSHTNGVEPVMWTCTLDYDQRWT